MTRTRTPGPPPDLATAGPPCESCRKPTGRRTSDGVPLCSDCAAELVEEQGRRPDLDALIQLIAEHGVFLTLAQDDQHRILKRIRELLQQPPALTPDQQVLADLTERRFELTAIFCPTCSRHRLRRFEVDEGISCPSCRWAALPPNTVLNEPEAARRFPDRDAALKEAKRLARATKRTMAIGWTPEGWIVIVDDGSDDSTASRYQAYERVR